MKGRLDRTFPAKTPDNNTRYHLLSKLHGDPLHQPTLHPQLIPNCCSIYYNSSSLQDPKSSPRSFHLENSKHSIIFTIFISSIIKYYIYTHLRIEMHQSKPIIKARKLSFNYAWADIKQQNKTQGSSPNWQLVMKK